MTVQLREAPHRFTAARFSPPVIRSTAAKAFEELSATGLDDVSAPDLEVYRLVLLPAEFKRLCVRLDAALADHVNRTVDLELPFGSDLQHDVDRARRRRWAHRPNAEPLPQSWTVHEVWRIPGRLVLTTGREFTTTGIRGRLRFRYTVTTDSGECWLEAFDRDGRYRSLDPARVRTVHRKPKLRRRTTR
jgi:hypothetical protein